MKNYHIYFILLIFNVLPMYGQYTGGIGAGSTRGSYLHYTYTNGWSPESPDGFTTGVNTINTVFVESGTSTLASATNAKRVEISSGAALEATSLTLTDSVLILADGNGYGMYKGSQQNVRIQQYVANAGWHNMALPVSGNLDQFGSVNTSVHPNTRNLYTWNALTGSWSDVVGAGDGSAVSNTPGIGYNVYVGDLGVISAGAVINARGELATSATPTLEYFPSGNANLDGWNLIGNPFTCALDFSQLGKNNVNNAFSIWNPISESYQEFSPLSTTYIAPFQAFWVKATGANPSLTGFSMTSSAATITTVPTFYKTTVADRFYVQVVAQSNPLLKDEILIGMVPGTSDGLDSDWDAPTRLNPANVPTLMMVNQNEQLAHNAIDYSPQHQQPKHLPLHFSIDKPGETFIFSVYDSLLTNKYTLVLEDQVLGVLHNFSQGNYTFTHQQNSNARFILHIAPENMSTEEFAKTLNMHVQMQGSDVVVYGRTQENLDGSLYNINGQCVRTFRYEAGALSHRISTEGLITGIYVLRVGTESFKVFIP